MKNAMRTYLNIEVVSSLDDPPSFVCDVLLNECKLVISKYEVAVSANVTATIIERASGEIVWENTEYGKVPIKSNYKSNYDMNNYDEAQVEKLNDKVNEAYGLLNYNISNFTV